MALKLTFQHVEAFRAVMASGSVVGAAKLLNVTQPGVSRTIGLMESRLGYALFERRGRRLLATPEAEALYREVEHAYGGLDRIIQVAQDIRLQRAGALRVATLPGLAEWLVPRAVAQFLSTRPGVTMFLQSLPSRQIADLVATRQFDVGVIELPMARPAIEIVPLQSARNVVVMPAKHPLAAKPVISIRDLDAEPMVLISRHSYVRYRIDDAFQKAGVAPKVVIETPSSTIACALVASGAGITLVSNWTAGSFVDADLVIRPLAEEIQGSYAIIFPQLATRMLLAEAFAAELQNVIRQSADPGPPDGSPPRPRSQ